MTIKLHDRVRDDVTGFAGMAVSRHEYLNGCVRFGVQPMELDKEGKPYEVEIFDVEQLSVIEEAAPRTVTPTGGPRNDPARPAAPRRGL